MKVVYVDLPERYVSDGREYGIYRNVAIFRGPTAREKAIEFCRELFGADDNGCISLLSIDEEEEEAICI